VFRNKYFVRRDYSLKAVDFFLVKKYKIKPKESMYIGDRFSDVRCAKKSGCIAVGIYNKCSWSNLSLIKREKPDYIIHDFQGLKKILKNK
jgi:phosphoglycolate phosphatase-like HAD superfamily hydrolase